MGKQNDSKFKQQTTLATKHSKDSNKPKEEEADDGDVQPAKKRKISNPGKKEDSDGDIFMRDPPRTADAATDTNGHLTPGQQSDGLFVSDDHGKAAKAQDDGMAFF